MFTVKATYLGETRKFIFDINVFPTYKQIYHQLLRVFPLGSSYYLANLIFSPFEGSKVLLGLQVLNEEQYNIRIAPFATRYSGGGSLKFYVIDGKDSQDVQRNTSFNVSESSDVFMPNDIDEVTGAPDNGLLKMSPERALNTLKTSTAQESPCCSLQQSKSEVKGLLDKFLTDFSNIMSSTFGEESIASSFDKTTRQPLDPELHVSNMPEASSSLTIPGSFVQDTLDLSPVENSDSVMRFFEGLWCSRCGLKINDSGFRCSKCYDHFLCDSCLTVQDNLRAHQEQYANGDEHIFLPNTLSVFESDDRQPIVEIANNSDTVIHSGFACNVCNQVIVGTRHKCLNCEDYDLCDNCYLMPILSHCDRHQFRSIGNSNQDFLSGARNSIHEQRVHGAERNEGGEGVFHGLNCKLCDSPIRGERYLCLNCPHFNLCSSCLSIVPDHHPRHAFVRISSPQDIVGGSPSGRRIMHLATCDECKQLIYGIRYKCAHPACPNFDLCEACESLPIAVHPDTHHFLKIRDPHASISISHTNEPKERSEKQSTHNRVLSDIAVETADMTISKADIATQIYEPEMTDVAVSTVTDDKVMEEVQKHTLLLSVSNPSSYETLGIFSTEGQQMDYLDSPLLPAEVHSTHLSSDMSDLLTMSPIREQTPLSIISTPDLEGSTQKDDENTLFSRFPTVSSSNTYTSYKATFIKDNNIEDGQIIFPGTKFLKSWRMRNDGDVAWPETTRLVFIAGFRMPCSENQGNEYTVGVVQPGEFVDVIARDMRAPDKPGKYIGYWRLCTGPSLLFGQSVWCEIVVPEIISVDDASDDLLSSSSVIMPKVSVDSTVDDADDVIKLHSSDITKVPSGSVSNLHGPSQASNPFSDDEDDGSEHDLSRPETPSDLEDNVVWEHVHSDSERSSSASPDSEYVVLYDDDSSSADEA